MLVSIGANMKPRRLIGITPVCAIALGVAIILIGIQGCGSKDNPSAPTNSTVYVTETGTKYHRGDCSYLSSSKIPMSCGDAVAAGYTACSQCKPSCD